MDQYVLPIELWEIIFAFATACAEEWEFGRCERYPDAVTTQWEIVLKTRRSLVAVSRPFNKLSIPLLYQSFFATTSGKVSCFRRTLKTRPVLGGYVKRVGLSARLESFADAYYPFILGICPNLIFCNTELRAFGSRPAPSLRSLELIVSPELKDGSIPHLLVDVLQTIPQLEHLGLYWLPFRTEMTNSLSFSSISVGSLRSLHLYFDRQVFGYPPGMILTVSLFFPLILSRLEDLLLGGLDPQGEVLDCLPASWLRQIQRFSVAHSSITSCSLEPNHFPLLRRLTLDFSLSFAYARGKLHDKLPLIQLEEIELIHCISPINSHRPDGFDGVYSVFCLCADDIVTPKLKVLLTDITEWEDKLLSMHDVKKRLNQLQSVVELVHVRGVDPKGINSSSLHSTLQKLITNAGTWLTEEGCTDWSSSGGEDQAEVSV